MVRAGYIYIEKMSSYYSLSSLDDALSRTLALLWPPSSGVWLRIILITLFIGGGLANPFQGDISIGGFNQTGGEDQGTYSLTPDILVPISLILFAILGFYAFFSSIFQFVFVDCLSSGNIILSRTFLKRIGKGMRLLSFYLILIVCIIVVFLFVIGTVMLPGLNEGHLDLTSVLLTTIITLLVLLVLLIPVWILAILTTDFVVPVMILDDCGIIQGWKKVLHLFIGRWTDAGIFVGMKIFITILTGVFLGIILTLTGVIFGLPDLVIQLDSGMIPVFSTTQIILYVVYGFTSVLISLFLMAPVIVFLRYYSLAMLGRINNSYQFLPVPGGEEQVTRV